jgi:hypothetical protein
VAGDATDTVVYMDAVIEKNEIGRPIDPVPGQLNIIRKTFPDRRQHGRLFPYLGMACHAGFGGRQTGEGRCLDAAVTVTAIEPESENVVFVAEGDRLFQRYHFERGPRRPINRVGNPHARANEKHDRRKTGTRDGVGPRTKNLRHISCCASSKLELAAFVPVEIWQLAGKSQK